MTMNEDRCICCGEIIPEGRMVCPNCLVTVKKGEDDD
jgi:RNA polymerase subunit RPABC4/transcription elongation factor Spt4